jgi:hypothetical protein
MTPSFPNGQEKNKNKKKELERDENERRRVGSSNQKMTNAE